METLKWAFARCWPLSAACEINWDAWAAMATMAGVLTALAAPWIRDWALRRKADAVFALAYFKALTTSAVRLQTYRTQFPLGFEDEAAWQAEALLMTNENDRQRFITMLAPLRDTFQREVDLTKWPAVSQDLAFVVASALFSLQTFEQAVVSIEAGSKDGSMWTDFWPVYRKRLSEAQAFVDAASQKCALAIKKSRKS